jgi:hypothetical protein
MFSMGQHVKAQWTNGNWYGARVLQFNGQMYEVAWDDGSPNLWIGAHQIQPDTGGGMQFAPGQHVRAQWTNGNWYGARVLQFNGQMYEVAWDDGSPNLWIATHQIQPDTGGAPAGFSPPMGGGMQFAPGQHVRAQWTNGNWYGARVLQFNGQMYEVAWDDGSPNLWIATHQIQPDTGGAPVGFSPPAGGAPVGYSPPMGGGAPGYNGEPNFHPGQHVRAQWTNGNWYGARILSFNGSQYEVAWDDGSPNLWIGRHQVQGEAGGGGMERAYTGGAMFAPGQHVTAQWQNGGWYGGRIVAQHGDAYEVAWDDGSPNLWLQPHQIRQG